MARIILETDNASGPKCILMKQAFYSSSDNPSVYKYGQTDGLSIKTNYLLSSFGRRIKQIVRLDGQSVCLPASIHRRIISSLQNRRYCFAFCRQVQRRARSTRRACDPRSPRTRVRSLESPPKMRLFCKLDCQTNYRMLASLVWTFVQMDYPSRAPV